MTVLTVEERERTREAMTEAWSKTTNVSVATSELRSILNDAVQAHEPWATAMLDEATARGLATALKKHRTSTRRSVESERGRINGVVGVLGVAANGISTEWQQLPLSDLTFEQLAVAFAVRSKQRDASTKALGILRRLLTLVEKHPATSTVAGALALEGVTLDDWLAA